MPALGWRPQDFWSASLVEFFAAVSGYIRANGGDDGPDQFTRDDYERLKERFG